MANNDDHNRTHHRPEDNPFIAFRRFTDSQVSSLLNTVFTLPATLANYNNAHHAREQCLFGKADQRQCDKLKDIEAGISELRNEGRELFRVGDVQAVLRNSEELMRLDRRADDIRREILGGSVRYVQHKVAPHDNGDIVERVANEKGQEWGWSWDWGFPRPFDHGHESSRGGAEEQTPRESTTPDSVSRTLGLVSELANAFEDWRVAAAAHADGQWDHPSYAPGSLETNPAMDAAGVAWIAAYQDLIVTEARERRNRKKSEGLMPGRIAKTPISQQHLEEAMGRDGEPTCPSSLQSGWLFQPKIPITQRQLEETLERDAEPSCPRLAAQDEPSYEYSHDHEDQHDDPPTPRRKPNSFAQMLGLDHTAESENETAVYGKHAQSWGEPETEMDVYERLDAATESTTASAPTSVTSAVAGKMNETKPSILSTLTTTERTVAPDGSITTKVLLKKRFADGREESSETVHTQRGQESDAPARDPWRALQNAQATSTEDENGQTKRNSWFWSS